MVPTSAVVQPLSRLPHTHLVAFPLQDDDVANVKGVDHKQEHHIFVCSRVGDIGTTASMVHSAWNAALTQLSCTAQPYPCQPLLTHLAQGGVEDEGEGEDEGGEGEVELHHVHLQRVWGMAWGVGSIAIESGKGPSSPLPH